MKEFDSIKEMTEYASKCPLCQKPLVKLFANGKYEDIINFGHKDSIDFRITKNKLKLSRSFELEGTPINAQYNIDTNTQKFKLELTPSVDELVEKFPVSKGFMDLERDGTFNYAIHNGLINIWRIINRLSSTFFFIQQCAMHFKRIHIMDFKENEDEFDTICTYDEFYYVPTYKAEDEYYTIHDHKSPASKKQRVIFIQKVTKDTIDNIDPMRGGMYLWENKDHDLMNFDFSDMKKLSRRVSSIHALRG